MDGRFKPDIMALGSGDVVASPYGDHTYTYASGTSFSCPLSAGVAALILCANPNLTPMEVRDAMRNTASQSSNPDNLYGWGILNALDAINYFPVSDSTTFQLTVQINSGWNVVSIPGNHPDGNTVDNWWPYRDSLTNVFFFSNGYQVADTLTPGEGYWLRHLSTREYNTGDEWPASGIIQVPHNPLDGFAGWNIIGGYEDTVATAGLTTTPPGLIDGLVYVYLAGLGYLIADTLVPGNGYWIRLTGDGLINIPQAPLGKGTTEVVEYYKEDWGKITIIDNEGRSYTLYAVKGEVDLNNYELPPSPPVGMFDIRFGSGRIAEDINSSIQSIEMSGIEHPVRVKVENMNITLQDESGKEINVELESGEEITIDNIAINKLLVLSGEFVSPIEYALEQNYPNPFNPSTIIKFSVPKEVQVKLSVFNILGEKVKELRNEMMKPGYYEVEFNASTLASGVYLYRIKAGDFIETKKMVLMK